MWNCTHSMVYLHLSHKQGCINGWMKLLSDFERLLYMNLYSWEQTPWQVLWWHSALVTKYYGNNTNNNNNVNVILMSRYTSLTHNLPDPVSFNIYKQVNLRTIIFWSYDHRWCNVVPGMTSSMETFGTIISISVLRNDIEDSINTYRAITTDCINSDHNDSTM